MPVEAASVSNSSKSAIGQGRARGTTWEMWLFGVTFFGFSAFAFTSEILDLYPASKGNTAILKFLVALLAGIVGAFAAAHSKPFVPNKRE
jgi:hypothetical protein